MTTRLGLMLDKCNTLPAHREKEINAQPLLLAELSLHEFCCADHGQLGLETVDRYLHTSVVPLSKT